MAGLPPALNERVANARRDRARHQNAINDFFRFADPTKPRIGEALMGMQDRSQEADELFDTTLQEVAEDFASDLIGRIMPRHTNWLQYEPQDSLPQEVQVQIADQLNARTTTVFANLRSSDFYNEAASEWAMDQGHGTSGLIGVDLGGGQPHHWEAIPPAQLLLERGSRGGTSFRAREYTMAAEEALAFWPKYNWPASLRTKAKRATGKRERFKLLEAATRVYDNGDEKWTWQVCADDHLIHEEELVGSGCCPILACRWRTHSTSAWGIGPLRKTVPDARTLDQERYLVLKNLGKVVDPPVVYDDDGVLNPEGGVDAGMWIPRMTGSKVDAMDVNGKIEAAYYEQGGLQDNIRRAGYQYGPRQRGKTPPTLGQWMDEKSDEGRRLEMPTGKLYAESVIAIVERTDFMLVKAGKIPAAIQVKGSSQLIKVRPLNPLAKQQDMEEVQTAVQLMQQSNAVFGPQATASFIDPIATFTNIKKKLNDSLVVLRTPTAAAPLLDGVLGAQPPGGGAQPQPPQGPAQ